VCCRVLENETNLNLLSRKCGKIISEVGCCILIEVNVIVFCTVSCNDMLNAVCINNNESYLGICLAGTVKYASAECKLAVKTCADKEIIVDLRALASDIVAFAYA